MAAQNAREMATIKDIKRKISEHYPMAIYRKRHGDDFSIKGDPDLEIMLFGLTFMLEVKQAGKDAEPIQKVRLEEWARAGAVVGVVHSWDEVHAIFNSAEPFAAVLRAFRFWAVTQECYNLDGVLHESQYTG